MQDAHLEIRGGAVTKVVQLSNFRPYTLSQHLHAALQVLDFKLRPAHTLPVRFNLGVVQAANIGFTVRHMNKTKKNLAGHAGVRGPAVRMLERACS